MTDTFFTCVLEDSFYLYAWFTCWFISLFFFETWKFSKCSEQRQTFKRFILNYRIGNLICMMIEPQGRLILSILLADISTYTVTFLTNSEDCRICHNLVISMIGITLSILSCNLANDLETTVEFRISRGTFVMMCQIVSFGLVLISIKYYIVGLIMIMIGLMLFLLWTVMNEIVNEQFFNEFKYNFEDDLRKKVRCIKKHT